MTKNRMNIAVIPGDGIGKEVVPEGPVSYTHLTLPTKA